MVTLRKAARSGFRACALAALASLLSASLVPRVVRACAAAPPEGAWVEIATESAIIVWDEAAKTEHFIRRATFVGSGKGFGFLVPTPTRPTLAAIDDAIFAQLAARTRPPVETQHEPRVELASCALMFFSLRGAAPSAAPPPVRVLEEVRVAGYDAVILEADDPKALSAWLSEHGYADRPSLAGWLAPYVAAKWKVTAFKIAPPDGAAATAPLGTEAVRMTFETERPFFPYREPEDQRAADRPGADVKRELLLYVLADRRMIGGIGESGPFPGSVPYARRGEVPAALAPLAKGLGSSPFLTVLVDASSPRQGTDELFLKTAGEQGEVSPAAKVVVVGSPVIPIPVEPVLLVAGVVTAFVVRRRRKAA